MVTSVENFQKDAPLLFETYEAENDIAIELQFRPQLNLFVFVISRVLFSMNELP